MNNFGCFGFFHSIVKNYRRRKTSGVQEKLRTRKKDGSKFKSRAMLAFFNNFIKFLNLRVQIKLKKFNLNFLNNNFS